MAYASTQPLSSFLPSEPPYRPPHQAPAPPPVEGVDALLRAALDPRSWLAACPGLHIMTEGQSEPALETVAARQVGDEELFDALGDLRAEGYLELPHILSPADAVRMEAAAKGLHDLGLPPVFSFVFDEPWAAAARMGTVLAATLGPGYRQLPDFWAWYIQPSNEGRGWVPHRDRPGTPRNDGLPATVSLWVALSESTPRNGCMYILPRGRDTLYGTGQMPELTRDQLQDLRALPATPGTAFIWDQDVYHWGGRSSAGARRARVSFACEFQRGDFPAYNTPLIDPRHPPDFLQRLRLIGKQLHQYRHMHKLSPQLQRLAEQLIVL